MEPPSGLSVGVSMRAARDGKARTGRKPSTRQAPNNVQRLREEQLLSKAELARRAGVSPLTIDRIERGEACRLDTKRKVILALGLKVSDREKVFLNPPRRGARPARRGTGFL